MKAARKILLPLNYISRMLLSTISSKKLLEIRKEILDIQKSWNPFTRFLKIPGLREEEHQLERANKDEREKERDEREKENREREKESRVINVIGEDEILRFGVTRNIFSSWALALKTLVDEDQKHVLTYEEIVEGRTYMLQELISNSIKGYFDGEAAVQTRDCVNSIINGIVGLEDFSGPDVEVHFEYKIDPPKDIAAKNKKDIVGFKFPLKPDAILISADKKKWLILESKHRCKNSDIILFAKKAKFIFEHKNEKWVRRYHLCPTEIITAMCSVCEFSSVPSPTEVPVTKLIREKFGYRVLA